MNADELRAAQAPIKQRYRDDPASARVAARAEAVLDADDIACDVSSWSGGTHAGLHRATGGSGALACSADMLLEALAACAGVTLKAVATAMNVPLRGAKVIVEGHWDARGTLGIDKTAPIGLTDIAIRFEIDSDAAPDKIKRLVDTAERYCVILQTLRNPPTIAVNEGAAS